MQLSSYTCLQSNKELGARSVVTVVHEVDEDIVTLTVGDDDAYALGCRLGCNATLALHASASCARLGGLDVVAQVLAWLDDADEARLRVGWVARVYAVDVAEDD